jgi:hypothetical protein
MKLSRLLRSPRCIRVHLSFTFLNHLTDVHKTYEHRAIEENSSLVRLNSLQSMNWFSYRFVG